MSHYNRINSGKKAKLDGNLEGRIAGENISNSSFVDEQSFKRVSIKATATSVLPLLMYDSLLPSVKTASK